LTATGTDAPHTAFVIPISACASWRVADIYQIAKNCRTSVEMIEKFYAAHLKHTLDAAMGAGERR
jgi:hypothetical protein